MLTANVMDQLWSKLHIHYGESWMRKWAGLDPSIVKAEWQSYLGGVTKNQVKWALMNLPEFPPNASQFRELCWKAPATSDTPAALRLMAPRTMDQKTKAAYERFQQAFGKLWQ